MITAEQMNDKLWRIERAITTFAERAYRYYISNKQKYGYTYGKFGSFVTNQWSPVLRAWINRYPNIDLSDPNNWVELSKWNLLADKMAGSARAFGIVIQSKSPSMIGASMSDDLICGDELEKFRSMCTVGLRTDDAGQNPTLFVSVCWKGKCYERTVNLQPIMQALSQQILSKMDPVDAEIGGWFDSIKKVARHVSETKAVKSLYGDLKSAAKNRTLEEAAASAALGPEAGAAIHQAYQVHDLVLKAKKGHKESVAKLHKLKRLAKTDHRAAQAVATAAQINTQLNDKAQQFAGGFERNQFGQFEDNVAGWLWNKTYRSNGEVVMDGLGGKFPTVGMAIREGYYNGQDLIKNIKRRSIFHWNG